MNRIYDNGAVLLGSKRDIEEYTKEMMKKLDYTNDMRELLEEIKDFKEDTIFAINYDNAMGFSMEYWDSEDRIERGEE